MLDKFKIGHYTDSVKGTGCTVILCEDGAVGGCSIRGSSPATRETDLLKTEKTVSSVNAVVLSGGSAFGLEAGSGVMDYLYEQGKGYNAGKYRVPIVVGASIYDLEYKEFGYPDKSAGYEAAKNAKAGNFERGVIGGASGATISKLLGMPTAVKTSLGVQTYSLNGLEIAVIMLVNALGDVIKDGEIIVGALDPNGKPISMKKIFTMGGIDEPKCANTTIGCILTNAKLTKAQANLLSDLAHDGFALALSPSHTRFDGDAMFTLASGEVDVAFDTLGAIIPDLTARAIQSSVTETDPIETRISPMMFKLFQKIWKKLS
ncbi:MAG: P1 family peptidase [Clostridia bacterium]|nr:P1 family peptidase [Clostridia bacterium]